MAEVKFHPAVHCLTRVGVLGLLCALHVWAGAQIHTGKVIRILDGDTLEILAQGAPLRVRLAYIDAPEKGQAYSERSRQALAALCSGQAATVRTVDTDRYGRTVGEVFCQSKNANRLLVQEGMAWVYLKYTPKDHPFFTNEQAAQAAGRGLWLDADPTPPWEWRRARRSRKN